MIRNKISHDSKGIDGTDHEGGDVDDIHYGSCMLVQMGSITKVHIGIDHDSEAHIGLITRVQIGP